MTIEKITNGKTYKNKTESHTFYTTINHDEDGNLCEVFVRLDDPEHLELISVITRLCSMSFKAGIEPMVIAKQLQEVCSPTTKHIIPGTIKTANSITARIGMIIEEHINLET